MSFNFRGLTIARSKMTKTSKLDSTKAFTVSLQYQPKDIVFGNNKLKVFLSEKGRKLASDPRMMLPGLLGSTSNAMGTCKVFFCLVVTTNYKIIFYS